MKPLVIEEVRRILLEHLDEIDLSGDRKDPDL